MAPSPRSNAVSPLMPRSPSNLNIGSPSNVSTLAMRKSISKPAAAAEPPSKKRKVEIDMAEQHNQMIGDKYVRGEKLGEGTYAVVYSGHLRSDPDKLVAIKKFKVDPSQTRLGLNVDTIRELKYLQELHNPSIIAMYDIFSTKDQNINMVIENCPNGSIEDILRSSIPYTAADIKAWMGMLCRAVYYCHSHFVLHRDIKPNNLLVAADGSLKLADFGLARCFAGPDTRMTANVITMWYRPMELLFGASHYSGAVDVWSVGCVYAEMVLRRPFIVGNVNHLPGQPDQAINSAGGLIAQIERVCEVVGTPNEDNWPGVSGLRDWFEPKKQVPVRDKAYFMSALPTAGSSGIDFLMRMMTLDPRKRATAKELLYHDYWRTEPRPTEAGKLPVKSVGGAEATAAAEVAKPGAVDEERYKGVARKLDFGSGK
jgi:cyclin-dependent kinase 7